MRINELLVLVIIVFLMTSCTKEYDSQLVEYEKETSTLEKETTELNAQLDELNINADENQIKLDKYLNVIRDLRDDINLLDQEIESMKEVNELLVRDKNNITIDELIQYENGTNIVRDQFKPRMELLFELLEKDGITNYFDPSFLEVGMTVGGLEVIDVQGLLWLYGSIYFKGEYSINCRMSNFTFDNTDVLVLSDENDEVIKPINFYNSQEEIQYRISNIEEFKEMIEGKEIEDKLITLRVKDYHLNKSQVGTSQFVNIVEILDISD